LSVLRANKRIWNSRSVIAPVVTFEEEEEEEEEEYELKECDEDAE